jgi:hypothetical protein
LSWRAALSASLTDRTAPARRRATFGRSSRSTPRPRPATLSDSLRRLEGYSVAHLSADRR